MAEHAVEFLDSFRVVIVNGPRQSGKATLLQQLQACRGGTYLTLDDVTLRAAAHADPEVFVANDSKPMLIDEIQRGGDDLLSVDAEGLGARICPVRGPLVESFIANELAKQATWSPFRLNLYHWRVSQGPEVDVVVERTNGRVVGIEAKATDAVDLKDFKGLIELRDSLGDQFVHGYVLHSGRRSLAFGDRLTALPISALWDR